jgi:secretion/DNA translocation related TadE-like protein
VTRQRGSGDDGSATVAGAAAILGLVALAGVIGYGVTGPVHRHRAEAAADLTALSAASSLITDGTGRACAVAEEIASRNHGAVVTDCRTVVAGDADSPAAPASSRGEEGVLVTVRVGTRSATAVAGP